jgi:plasmid stability protein
MATLTVRQLDDDVYEDLRARARANNRSVEAEVRQLIADHVQPKPEPDFSALFARLAAHRQAMREKYGVLSDSTEIIRQMRDEDG